MPYVTEWVSPDVFLEYKDVIIYRSYKNDDYDNPMSYWFTTSVQESDEYEFDVRELDDFNEDHPDVTTGKEGDELKKLQDEWKIYFEKTERKIMIHAMKLAIDTGKLPVSK